MVLWFWLFVFVIVCILLVSAIGIIFVILGGVIGYFGIGLIIEYLFLKEIKSWDDKLSTLDGGMQTIFRFTEFLKKYKVNHKDFDNLSESEILNITNSVKDRELAELICYIHSIGCELVVSPVTAELADNIDCNLNFLEDKNKVVLSNKTMSSDEIDDMSSSIKRLNDNCFILREINPYRRNNLFREFQKSCTLHGVSVYPNTNLYNLLLSLRRKNLHYELSKDGYAEYNLSSEINKSQIGKWEKIKFSAEISSEDFALCLRYIFSSHSVNTIKHPDKYKRVVDFSEWRSKFRDELSDNTKNDLLSGHNEFIFWGLFMMHYRLTISDKEDFNVIQVKDIKTLKQYISEDEQNLNLNDVHFQNTQLADICQIIKVEKTDDSNISTNKDYLPIIFSEDILSQNPALKYYTSIYTNEKDLVINNDIIVNATDFSIISLWKGGLCHPSNEIIVIKGDSTDLMQQYLFLYLKAVFGFFHSVGLTNITNIYSFKNIEVLVPSKQIQKHIIDKAKDDDFDILTYLEEFYPHMPELMEKIEKLYSNSNYVPSSHSYYSGYGSVYVKGYIRKDGVYVRGHSRRK